MKVFYNDQEIKDKEFTENELMKFCEAFGMDFGYYTVDKETSEPVHAISHAVEDLHIRIYSNGH